MTKHRKTCADCGAHYTVTVDLGGRLCDLCVGLPEVDLEAELGMGTTPAEEVAA